MIKDISRYKREMANKYTPEKEMFFESEMRKFYKDEWYPYFLKFWNIDEKNCINFDGQDFLETERIIIDLLLRELYENEFKKDGKNYRFIFLKKEDIINKLKDKKIMNEHRYRNGFFDFYRQRMMALRYYLELWVNKEHISSTLLFREFFVRKHILIIEINPYYFLFLKKMSKDFCEGKLNIEYLKLA